MGIRQSHWLVFSQAIALFLEASKSQRSSVAPPLLSPLQKCSSGWPMPTESDLGKIH